MFGGFNPGEIDESATSAFRKLWLSRDPGAIGEVSVGRQLPEITNIATAIIGIQANLFECFRLTLHDPFVAFEENCASPSISLDIQRARHELLSMCVYDRSREHDGEDCHDGAEDDQAADKHPLSFPST